MYYKVPPPPSERGSGVLKLLGCMAFVLAVVFAMGGVLGFVGGMLYR